MSIDSVHPEYSDFIDSWVSMRDFYKGERVVKSKRTTYLPPTKGMLEDGMYPGQLGYSVYDAYLKRSLFPDVVKIGIETYLGLMHKKDAIIELPSRMEPLRESATLYGESLQMILRRINEEQLVTGRAGLLLDLPQSVVNTEPIPYITIYSAENITNWDDGSVETGSIDLNLVVLKESGYIRENSFDWKFIDKFRVLQLGSFLENEKEGASVYSVGTFSNFNSSLQFNESEMITPQLRGAYLDKIPFVFVNSKDIVSSPDEPPLFGLGRLALAIYRGEADYRQNLFAQGQDTLVIKGAIQNVDSDSQGPVRLGVGSLIKLDETGDAKFIGVSSGGLPEMRLSLENDYKRAETKAGQLIANNSGVESSVTLRTRIESQTATLNQIAITGANALEKILKTCAEWMGLNPSEVSVQPNLEFTSDYEATGLDLMNLKTFQIQGGPISDRSLHAVMKDRGITKMEYDDELKEIEKEQNESEGVIDLSGEISSTDEENTQ